MANDERDQGSSKSGSKGKVYSSKSQKNAGSRGCESLNDLSSLSLGGNVRGRPNHFSFRGRVRGTGTRDSPDRGEEHKQQLGQHNPHGPHKMRQRGARRQSSLLPHPPHFGDRDRHSPHNMMQRGAPVPLVENHHPHQFQQPGPHFNSYQFQQHHRNNPHSTPSPNGGIPSFHQRDNFCGMPEFQRGSSPDWAHTGELQPPYPASNRNACKNDFSSRRPQQDTTKKKDTSYKQSLPDKTNMRGTSASRSQFLELDDLLSLLIRSPVHTLAFDSIISKLGCSENALKFHCNKHKFLDCSLRGSIMKVELSPDIRICKNYLKESGCLMEQHCGYLHICTNFVSGSCSDGDDCEFGHTWKTSHNTHLFSKFHLDSYSEPILHSLMKKVIRTVTVLDVCAAYNSGTCTTTKYNPCSSLHICRKAIVNEECDLLVCTLNHNILNEECIKVLKLFHIDTCNSKRDVMTKVQLALKKMSTIKDTVKKKTADQKTKKVATNSKTFNLLDVFSSIDEQEKAVKRIVRSLLVAKNYWNPVEKVSFDLKPDDVSRLAKEYNKLFVLHVTNSTRLIKLKTFSAVCYSYNSGSSCSFRKPCVHLHICKDFVAGDCVEVNCDLEHSLASRHNKEIIGNCFLDGVSAKLILSYFKKRQFHSKIPAICIPYNSNGCSEENCSKLHICYDHLFTGGQQCFTMNCQLNHNIFSPGNKQLLSNCKLSDASHGEILSTLSTCIVKWVKEDKTNTNVDYDDKQAENVIPGHEGKSVTKLHIVDAYKVDGNVSCAEICLDDLVSKCNAKETSCPKFHSKVSYHWQFSKDNVWYNFQIPHSNIIEKAYRCVEDDSVSLKPLTYGQSSVEKQLLAFMNDNSLLVDFDKMTLVSQKSGMTLGVRRLSTPSSVTSKNDFATVYGWYFQDKNLKWIEYGLTDSTGCETHHSKESSKEIETAFIQNPDGQKKVLTDKFDYILNFNVMTQTNSETKVVRKIRRRPRYALIEKLKPNDPYGLKAAKVNKSPLKTCSSKQTHQPTPADVTSSALDDSSSETNITDGSSNFPPFWTSMPDDCVEIIPLDLSSPEAVPISRQILLTMPTAEVLKIRRLQNTFHWEAFNNHMDFMKTATGKETINIQRLIHGTREKYVVPISEHNFEWRQNFADSGKLYGRGAYFYNSAAVAYQSSKNLQDEGDSWTTASSDNEVVLAIADVFVGSVTKGTPDMARPPTDPTGGLYHTTVNDLTVPTIFVKYNTAEYCPHYFVNVKV